MKKNRAALLSAVTGGLLLAVAACSTSSSSSSTPAASSAPASTASSSAPASTATVITTRTSPDGTHLTDSAGRSVYLWMADSRDKSVCTGACTGAWPPVTAKGKVTAAGSAKAADLSVITRSDGSRQVTYSGHPLYYFSGDLTPGTVSGQGSNGFGHLWWLVSPAGAPVTVKAAASSVTHSGTGY